ncbi:MAG: amidohydrolase family protein, partial [Chloroflexi bacterium]|nr:amidohydrolase family protein [Chloroflexota bacterium]
SMDYLYTQRIPRPDWIRFKNGMLPSDFFRRNVFISFQEDDLAVRLRDQIGVDLLAWGTDYPHPEATFPRSQQFLVKMFKGVPEKEQAKVAGGNTARLYGFSRR